MANKNSTSRALEALEARRFFDGNGLTGAYYNGTTLPELGSGSPSIVAVTRVDANVNFYWGAGAPAAGITADKFSARWVGQIEPRYSETYTFSTRSDEGVRLWVDNKLIIDSWSRHKLKTDAGTITLQAGKRYDLRMEYYDFSGAAVARLMWQSASQAQEDVPTSQLFAQAPFSSPAAAPGDRIEAENFDLGARNVAYGDIDAGNVGKAYRNADVDIQATADAGGGYNIGWSRAGEWLEYTVDVPTAGTYRVDLRVAALGTGGMFHVEADGTDVTGAVMVPDTGGWQSWQTVNASNIKLTAGRHVLRVSQDAVGTSGWVGNLNWLELHEDSVPAVAVSVNGAAVSTDQTLPVEFGTSQLGGQGITQTFLVTNQTDASLELGGLTVPSGFVVDEALAAALAPGESDTFTLRLNTETAGRKKGVVQFLTSDPTWSSFAFTVGGTVAAPRLAVKQGTNVITSGESINFGSATVGSTGPSVIFTVTNEGNGTMTLGDVTLPEGYALVEGLSTTLAAGASDTFTVRLDASVEGVRSGSIVLASNDLAATSFTFAITGTVTPAGTGTPAISEDFTSGADNFAVVGGTWGLASGAYRLTADNNTSTAHLNSRAIHQTAMAGDFVLTVDAQPFAASAPWANAAVIFGYQDANNYYFFSSNQSNDGATNGIFRVVNGTSTELADASATITAGATYQLRVERSGSDIRAYRNGALIASASDATFTSGQVGVGTRQFQASFDNLVVTGTPVAPPSEPPAAPSGLVATATSTTGINLSWTDNSTTESGFKVERSSNGGTSWTQVASLGANVTQYAASGLTAATQYLFRVLATNVVGASPTSNVASATTQSAPAPGAGWDVKPDASNTGPSNPAALVGLPVRAPTAAG
ncbi:MAG TPA: PA14 domain-containing protein, partial [Tepidisphaeraceae bacterium]|nr:PA14 domain-containing protein [Tepidisphaeraceae bacterium]